MPAAVWLAFFAVVAIVALAGFWLGQRLRRQAAAPVQAGSMDQLMKRANCILWQAMVELREGGWKWEFAVPPSGLRRRMLGDQAEILPRALWTGLEVPDRAEMDRRCRDALEHGLSDYEQRFRVISRGQTLWLHESVSIVPAGPEKFSLVGLITDITAQHEAEQARHASEQKLDQLMAHAHCMLWQAHVSRGADGAFHWEWFVPRSELYRRIAGEDPNEQPIMPWGRKNVPEFEELEARSRHAMLHHLPGYEQEFRVIMGNEVLWMHEQAAITRMGPDSWNLEGVVIDITAQRRAEEEQRKSEARLRQVLERADCTVWQGITTEKPEGGVTWQLFVPPSRLFRRIYGHDSQDMSGFHWDQLQVPEFDEMTAVSEKAMRDGASGYAQVFHVPRPEGDIWLSEQVSITPAGPGRWELVGVITDITSRHEAEMALAEEKERLAVTLRAMAEGVITTGVDGRVHFINPAAAHLMQCDDAAIGKMVGEVCRLEDDRSGVSLLLPLGPVADRGLSVPLPPHARLIVPDGRRRLVEGCAAPIHAAEGKITGVVLVFRDVTDHERLEQELVRATRLESVGILAGGIAHDFNNILTGVMGNLALAQLDLPPTGEITQRLREAEKATLRARDLTQQLLTFAKGGDPVRSAVQLEMVVRETTEFALHGANVKAVYDLPPGLWAADADKGQLGRVVQNLVINAMQAMPEGGTVRLSARNERIEAGRHHGLAAGDYLKITVSDSGVGIKPEHLPRIFDPYFTTKQSGSGLGLAAVYSIIKKHRGFIDVESQLGRGSTFHFWLPALCGSAAVETGIAPDLQGKFTGRVLFMDDEAIIRRTAGMILERFGFTVEYAADGREAVEKYSRARERHEPFTLVIMDLTVPGGLGGREAIAQLRAIDPTVRAIVSSGYSSDPVMANYHEHGFCARIAKPYQIEDFVRVLREAMAQPSPAAHTGA